MKKRYLFLLAIPLFAIIIILSGYNNNINYGYIPKDGFVPNEITAIKIAEAIWLPIYGNTIYEMKPFNAELIDSTVWIVKGTLPKGTLGGVPYIEIQKSNCKILKVIHGK